MAYYIRKEAAIEAAIELLDSNVGVLENDYDIGYQSAVRDIVIKLNKIPDTVITKVINRKDCPYFYNKFCRHAKKTNEDE